MEFREHLVLEDEVCQFLVHGAWYTVTYNDFIEFSNLYMTLVPEGNPPRAAH